jgi:pimeloyl-ACP methyl ester carboxylesterase
VAGERVIHVGGVELCTEAFGNPGHPPVLLVMGIGGSMLWWDEAFCAMLAARGRHVIRYDQRDTGRSVTYDVGRPGYTGADLVADAARVLDGHELPAAHVVGVSAGGALAQVLALDHPERVASLTLVATSPAGPDPDLPPMTDEAGAAFAAIAEPDWSDRAAVIEYLTEQWRASVSRSQPFDEEGTRALCARVVDRTTNMESSLKNPYAAEGSDRWRERLGGLDVPTLVVHGTEDPLFPLGHGVALAREIPGAELLTLEGGGHELARRDWDVVVPAILRISRES